MFYVVKLADGTVIDFEGKCVKYIEAGKFTHFHDEHGVSLGAINSDCILYIIIDEVLDSIQEPEEEDEEENK